LSIQGQTHCSCLLQGGQVANRGISRGRTMRVEIQSSGNTSVAVVGFDAANPPGDAIALAAAEELFGQVCAVFLRGLGITEPARLRHFLENTNSPLLDYRHGNSPRRVLADGIYSSTEYPSKYEISLHSELSFAASWPSRLYFCCRQPAAEGGETCLSDAAALLNELSSSVRDEFVNRGVLYRQSLHGGVGLGKSWQETYLTDNPDEVARYLDSQDVRFEWLPGNHLRTYQIRPATRKHQKQNFDVWFNQADQWHLTNLPPDDALALREIVEDEYSLPLSVSYGDGTTIPAAALNEIRAVAQRNAVDVPWERGDLLVVDNMAALHGRRSFTGNRQVLLAMS
jgi:alpha-ketoglutarate-dependent taurine dioxygenase